MSRPLYLSAAVIALSANVFAINPQNAGPTDVEIKFKLPPPKPLTPEEELKTLKVQPGYRVELFASEPMIEAPVAMSWDERGRMYVVEMRGYMHDVDGQGEDQPLGVISILEDTDHDGKADKKTVFADGLILPRSITAVNGGALVGEPPNLWFMKDTDGDGKADVKELVDGSFGQRGGQPEHMANSPTRFLDNWFYSANHGKRYRLKDGKWISEGVPIRGQWGMCQDNYGRPYFNMNSDFLRTNVVPEVLYSRNSNLLNPAGGNAQVVKDQSTYPAAPTPGVNRGYEPASLTADGKLTACTATCGAAVYRGQLKEFAGDVFIPEPAGNLIKRITLSEKDAVVTGTQTLEKQEFIASTDERFRPVSAYTGPDGALYFADMARGIIQHKGFLTHYLIANIKDRNLAQPVNMGRIWRVVPDGAKVTAPVLPTKTADWVPLLSSPNGWIRDTAQRVLVDSKDASLAPAIAAIAKQGESLGKLHALWTLEGLGVLTPDVVTVALKDSDAKVRAAAIRLADRSLVGELAKLVSDSNVDVQIALGFVLSSYPEAEQATVELASNAGGNAYVSSAIISGLRGRELEVLEALLGKKKVPTTIASGLSAAVMKESRPARVEKLIQLIAAQPANSEAQGAMLAGAGTGKAKRIYLSAEVPALAKLKAEANDKLKKAVAALDDRVAWPNKPGVPPAPVIKPLTEAEKQLFEKGKQTYQTICAACHQPNGLGMEGLAPALVDSDWVLGDPKIVAKIVMNGVTGPIKVDGRAWTLEMPPIGAGLTNEQIAGVTTYIRREWEHTASPITVEDVTRIREENKTRAKGWTADELRPPTKKGK